MKLFARWRNRVRPCPAKVEWLGQVWYCVGYLPHPEHMFRRPT